MYYSRGVRTYRPYDKFYITKQNSHPMSSHQPPTMTTVDKIIKNLTHLALMRIGGKPSYATTKVTKDQLRANATFVRSDLGGGAHSHLAVTVSPTIYDTITATPFVAPTNPTCPDLTGLIAHQISACNRAYDHDRKAFKEYNRLQTMLKKQIIAVVKPIYLKALKQQYVKFGNRTIY